MNEVSPTIIPAYGYKSFQAKAQGTRLQTEPGGHPVFRRQSWAFREAKVARILGAKCKTGAAPQRQSAGNPWRGPPTLQLKTDGHMCVRKLVEATRKE